VDAYEQLVTRYQSIAFRTALMLTGSPADAEEVAQDGFVKAYYALDRFRDDLPFRPWLLQIVATEARNRRKANTRRFYLSVRAAEQADPHASEPSPESLALSGERRQALLEAVETLRDEERLVVTCRYFLELSEAETAEALGLPKGTVKSRLARALARLRGRLADADAPDGAPDPGSKEQAAHG
jgi:RNA polymerase sigma-70 factor (ECF subfamily)